MEIIIILVLISAILILMVGLEISPKKIKQIKDIGTSKENNELIKDFPSNKQICEEILEMLDNKNVGIEETSDEKSQTSLYLVMSNKILIANINNTFTRIQTIAHECIHSIQNKQILKFNFIFSNINNLYFIIICLLALFKVTNEEANTILLVALILMQFVFYIVRSFLETDAMTRAEYVTKEYIEKKNITSSEVSNEIMSKYRKLNKIGIKLYNFVLAVKSLLKPIMFLVMVLISKII